MPPPPDDRRPDKEPSELEMLARGLLATPRYMQRVARGIPSTLPNLEDTPILGDLPGAKTLGRTTAWAARTLRGRPSQDA